MFRNSSIRPGGLAAAALAALVAAPGALAGGFGLTVELPGGRTNAKARDAVMLVSPDGCHGPGATVTAIAEGRVNGRRQSVPLKLTAIGTNSAGVTTYALRRQWPAEGAWLLSFTGTSRSARGDSSAYTATCRAILELGPGGSIPTARLSRDGNRQLLPIRYVGAEAREIDTALKQLAQREPKSAAISRSAR